MARLNITFGNLTSDGTAKPASTAEGMTYSANTVTIASLAAGDNNSNVYKVVHQEPVLNATLENLIAWIEENVEDYTNQLYEVYIPSIKTSNTTLSPTGKANTTYSFVGTKQSDHSMIARATVTANGTDEYPVGTVLESIIQPDFTMTEWRVVTSVQGIIEVSSTTSIAGRRELLDAAKTRAGGRENFTIIFNSVTFTDADNSPTHSTTDVFWCEVIKTDDRVFIRTSAAINAGGTYFNRVYYSRMDLELEVWSTWTPYNFQIMAIDQFTTSGVPNVYMQGMLNGYMMFTRGGMLYRLVKYDSTNNKAWFITDDNHRFKLIKNSTTGMWAIDDLSQFNIINFGTTAGTLSEDSLAYLDVAKTYTLEEDLGVLHHIQTTTSSTAREYNLMGTTYSGTTKYWIDVNTATGAYTVTTQSIGGSGIPEVEYSGLSSLVVSSSNYKSMFIYDGVLYTFANKIVLSGTAYIVYQSTKGLIVACAGASETYTGNLISFVLDTIANNSVRAALDKNYKDIVFTKGGIKYAYCGSDATYHYYQSFKSSGADVVRISMNSGNINQVS